MIDSDTAGWFGAFSGVLIGLTLGSFVGMASWRWPLGKNFIVPSSCPACLHRLTLRELIPVFSWVIQRGRTRCCDRPLSLRYPAVEALNGILLGIVGWNAGLGTAFILLAMLFCALSIGALIDLEWKIIPDGVNCAVAILGVCWVVFLAPQDWGYRLINVLQCGSLGVFLAYFYSKWRKKDMLGWGDVKLMAASGFWFPPQWVGFYLFFAALQGIGLSLYWRRRTGEAEYPFVPPLAVSLAVLMIWQTFVD